MTTKEAAVVLHHEIAHLAYLNWQTDGRPTGRDEQYWLEAEHQIKATKHLLLTEKPRRTGTKVAHFKTKQTAALRNAAHAA